MMTMLRRFEHGIPDASSGHNTNGAFVDWEQLTLYRRQGGKVFHCLCGDFNSRVCCVHVLTHLTDAKILSVPLVFSPAKLYAAQRPEHKTRHLRHGEVLSTSMESPLLAVVDGDDEDDFQTNDGKGRPKTQCKVKSRKSGKGRPKTQCKRKSFCHSVRKTDCKRQKDTDTAEAAVCTQSREKATASSQTARSVSGHAHLPSLHHTTDTDTNSRREDREVRRSPRKHLRTEISVRSTVGP